MKSYMAPGTAARGPPPAPDMVRDGEGWRIQMVVQMIRNIACIFSFLTCSNEHALIETEA